MRLAVAAEPDAGRGQRLAGVEVGLHRLDVSVALDLAGAAGRDAVLGRDEQARAVFRAQAHRPPRSASKIFTNVETGESALGHGQKSSSRFLADSPANRITCVEWR